MLYDRSGFLFLFTALIFLNGFITSYSFAENDPSAIPKGSTSSQALQGTWQSGSSGLDSKVTLIFPKSLFSQENGSDDTALKFSGDRYIWGRDLLDDECNESGTYTTTDTTITFNYESGYCDAEYSVSSAQRTSFSYEIRDGRLILKNIKEGENIKVGEIDKTIQKPVTKKTTHRKIKKAAIKKQVVKKEVEKSKKQIAKAPVTQEEKPVIEPPVETAQEVAQDMVVKPVEKTIKPLAKTSVQLDLPEKIGAAIAKAPIGAGRGEIDPNAPKGFGGIPGAPEINYATAFFWAIWVGWILSTVGAFGGIMAGVGHITIFGLGEYAKSFSDTTPTLNKLLTDTIRASNQYLVGFGALISATNFYRMRQLVLPLGIALGAGSVAGALLIPWLTAGKISLSSYIGYFGIAVLVIGGFLFYETSPRGQAGKSKAREAAKKFQDAVKEKGAHNNHGVQVTEVTFKKIRFNFYSTEFSFNPILPVAGGFVIAALASFLGIGGGFLYVPFMTSIVGLPMFLVAGTSAMAVLLSMTFSIFSYVAIKGTFISWSLIGMEMSGIFVGAMIGPRTQKYIPEIWLKRLFILLAMYVGLRYFSKGFFGQSWLPPY